MQKKLKRIAQVTVAMLRENRGLIAGLIGEIHHGLRGNCSDLRGDCSGLWGDCSGLSGNIDNCEINNEDRKNKINIADLTDE